MSANDAERDGIEAAAATLGLAPSVYLRLAGLDVRAGSRGSGGAPLARNPLARNTLARRADDVLYHRLSRLGVRLHGLARQAEAAGRADDGAALAALVAEVAAARAGL